MKKSMQLFAMILIAGSYPLQGQTIDKIIAKVGTEIILYSDWQEQIQFIRSRQSSPLETSNECSILEGLLIQKFLVNRAKVDSVEVKDEEVEQQLNARIEQILAYFNNDHEKFREYYGQSVADTRERFRDDLKNKLLTERLQNKIIGEVRISPEETRQFFEQIPKDSIPYLNAEVELSEIVYYPRLEEDQKVMAKERLEKILMRIREGEDFSKIASVQSDDATSARNGGLLGWAKRGTFVPTFEAVAFSLEKDSISGIFETEYGYHIVQLLERRGNSVLCKHILIKPRYSEDNYKQAQRHLDSIREVIVRDSIPFELAVRQYSDKRAESFNNGGQLLNPKTGTADFETADLDPDVFFAIDQLDAGQVSKAFSSTQPDGNKIFKIVRVNSKKAPHRANLKDDYAKIQQAAQENKKSQKFQEWLAANVPKAYISLDPSLQVRCPDVAGWAGENAR
ncbi:MAG: peptidylprolyl isomerase [Saprospiraceae bacterium]|nr:peptidylprolyl isomerase [Saprospiraceae bacterium]